MNKIWFVVIALVIVGAIYYFFTAKASSPSSRSILSSPSSSPTVAGTTDKSSTVDYTAAGFNPRQLTVKAGTTVIWKNDDTNPIMVESDPHPTHTNYPPMNSPKATLPGETYSFTFTQPGTYGYHNHLEATNTGTVIVQP